MSAVHLALDDRVEAFGGVDVDEAAKAHVFVIAVVDAGVAAERFARLHVDFAFVGHEVGRLVHAGGQVLFDVLRSHVRNVLRADLAIAFNERDNGMLLRLRLAVVDVLLLAAHIGFIALDNLVAAADWAGFAIADVIASRMRISRNQALLY